MSTVFVFGSRECWFGLNAGWDTTATTTYYYKGACLYTGFLGQVRETKIKL